MASLHAFSPGLPALPNRTPYPMILPTRSQATRLLSISVATFICASATAQQFTYQPGLVPTTGNGVWTEGVQAVDVDNDGDIDLCFSNGDGFTNPGAQRQCSLVINQLIPSGTLSFTDESVARLGVHLANGKGVTAGDVNGDGWVDLLYVNAFNTDTPFLFINRGGAQPGFFDMESSTRGFTENLSSAGAQFGDLDNDGDLDVIINDSGNSFLGGSGGKPRLYFNDGTGVFTEDAVAMNAPTKASHMDVQLVDLDGDYDVDFFGANRATNSGGYHYVMLNDGTGSFTNVSSLMPATSGSVYEAEVGDLDGDDDIDLFFVSLNGFQEGPMRNQLTETGSLGFTAGTPESGNVDDNEVVLMDYDNDGDLDSFIGSLGSRERLYRNDGNLTFTEQSAQIQVVGDPTLDMTAADLDNDGDYDLISAQGEGNTSQFANKIYLNSGPADTRAPIITGASIPAGSITWPVILKAKYSDSVLDDGVDYVSSRAFTIASQGTGGTTTLNGASFSPAALALQSGEGLVFSNMSGSQATFTCGGPTPFEFTLQNGQAIERVFIRTGTYNVTVSNSGATVSVNVGGFPQQADGLQMGVGQKRYAIQNQGVSTNNSFAAEIRFTDHAGNESWLEIPFVSYPTGGTVIYCSPNSSNTTGASASISYGGSFAVADQNFQLIATGMPTNEFGYFLVGETQGFVANPAGSFGDLCLGGALGRFNAINQIGNSGATGSFTLQVDLNAIPFVPVRQVMFGETYTFQAWYRDSLFAGSNFTDGLSVTFQ